jgi:DNA replication protein DnaC
MRNKMERLKKNLNYLKLPYILDNFQKDAAEAADKDLSHLDFLDELINAEAQHRYERMVQRRIRNAHFPFIKTLDQYRWTHPRKINRQQIQHLFHLSFIDTQDNLIFIGNTGVGKTHLAIALGYHACSKGHPVLFSTAMDIISHLSAAQAANTLIQGLKKYTVPTILIIDEIGYLPIDKRGADLLFQVISKRYERGSIIITTNRPFKQWPRIFDNDSTLTSAILDRLLHHGQVSLIDSRSYRMKDRINPNEMPQEDDSDTQQTDDKDK